MSGLQTETELLAEYLNPTDLGLKELVERTALSQITQAMRAYHLQFEKVANGVTTGEKQCDLPVVSQQRELLLAFAKHIEKAGYDGSCLTYEQELDEFLKANNCA